MAIGEDGRAIARDSDDAPVAGARGDIAAMALYAGQGVGLVRRVQPAGEIVREIAAEAAGTIARLHGVIGER